MTILLTGGQVVVWCGDIRIAELGPGHLVDHAGHHIRNLAAGRDHRVPEKIRGIERVIDRPMPRERAPRRSGDTATCGADVACAAIDLGWRTTRRLDELLTDHWRWQAQNPEGCHS